MVDLLSRSIVKVSPSAMLTTLPLMVSCSFEIIERQDVEFSKRKSRQIRSVMEFGEESEHGLRLYVFSKYKEQIICLQYL